MISWYRKGRQSKSQQGEERWHTVTHVGEKLLVAQLWSGPLYLVQVQTVAQAEVSSSF